MKWRHFHHQNPLQEQFPLSPFPSKREAKTPYTPQRKKSEQKSLSKSILNHNPMNNFSSHERIVFSYTVTDDWVERMKKQLKMLFKQLNHFFVAIKQEIEKLNFSNTQLIHSFRQKILLLNQNKSQIKTPIKVSSKKGPIFESFFNSTFEKEKQVIISKIKSETNRKVSQFGWNNSAKTYQSFKKDDSSLTQKTSQAKQTTQNNSSLMRNRSKNGKLNSSFCEMNDRIENLKKMLDQTQRT